MNANSAVVEVVEALESAGIEYMLVGGFSASAWGIARSTKDADFVIQLSSRKFADIADRLRDRFSCDPQSLIEFNTLTTRYVLKHTATAFAIELFLLSDDPHDQDRFRRRVQVPFENRSVWMPTAEDVVIMKLRWFAKARRRKDEEDALSILAVQRGRLDMEYVRRWCAQHQTTAILEDLLSRLPAV